MTVSSFPSVLLIAPASDDGGFEAARNRSIWRALCQCAETWRISVGAHGVSGPRDKTTSAAALAPAIARALEDSGAQHVVVAGGLDLPDGAVPADIRFAAVPDAAGRVTSGAREIWARTGDEAARVDAADRPVFVVRDAFAPLAAQRQAPPAGIIAVLGAPDSLPDDLAERLRDAVEIVTTPACRKAVEVAATCPIRVAETEDEALKLAGAVLLAAAPQDTAALRCWAQLNGRNILWPTPAEEDAASEECLDGLRAVDDAARALGTDGISADAEAVGALVARNLGLEFELTLATFHPWARLYHVIYDVRGAVVDGCVGGRISLRNGVGDGLVNAWVREAEPPQDVPARMRATAALAENVTTGDVVIEAEAWGWPVARFAAPEDLKIETAGLIGLDLSPDRNTASVWYWGNDPATRIQMGRKPIQQPPVGKCENGPFVFRAEDGYPFNRASLTALPPDGGYGQKFSQFRLFDARRPSSARLVSMKDSYAGRTGWLIGNGPSVRMEDLDRLADADCLCFGFNRFHLAHADTRLRPRFTVTGDRQMIEDFGQQIVDDSGGTVFVSDEQPPALLGDYVWLRQLSVFPSLFSPDAAHAVTPGGSSVYVAMQVGYYLGIRKWYIYGADFSFRFAPPRMGSSAFRTAVGDGNHFIANYRSGRPWCPPAIENILPSFYAARLIFEAEGGFIRNATRGGDLNVFERMDFDAALEHEQVTREPAREYG